MKKNYEQNKKCQMKNDNVMKQRKRWKTEIYDKK